MPLIIQSTLPRFDGLELFTAKDWRDLGLEVIDRIKTRTRAGLDVNGELFVDYSPGYAKQREAYGRGTAVVDLTVSGDMLNNLVVLDADKRSVTVGWLR